MNKGLREQVERKPGRKSLDRRKLVHRHQAWHIGNQQGHGDWSKVRKGRDERK